MIKNIVVKDFDLACSHYSVKGYIIDAKESSEKIKVLSREIQGCSKAWARFKKIALMVVTFGLIFINDNFKRRWSEAFSGKKIRSLTLQTNINDNLKIQGFILPTTKKVEETVQNKQPSASGLLKLKNQLNQQNKIFFQFKDIDYVSFFENNQICIRDEIFGSVIKLQVDTEGRIVSANQDGIEYVEIPEEIIEIIDAASEQLISSQANGILNSNSTSRNDGYQFKNDNPLSPKKLIKLKTLLEGNSQSFKLNGDEFSLKLNFDTQSLSIFKNNSSVPACEIGLDDQGVCYFVNVNGSNVSDNEIPSEMRIALNFALFIENNNYTFDPVNKTLNIKISRKSLKQCPEYHLDKLAQVIVKETKFKTNATFKGENGQDDGGLTPEFIIFLVDELKKTLNLKMDESGLAYPDVTANLSVYENLGKLMIFSFLCQRIFNNEPPPVNRNIWGGVPDEDEILPQKNKYPVFVLGKLFHPDVFDILFKMTKQEVSTSFEHLNRSTQFKLLNIYHARDSFKKKLIDVLKKYSESKKDFSEEEITTLAYAAFSANLLSSEFQQNEDVDLDKILKDKTQFIKTLSFDALLKSEMAVIEPIHAIANGMVIGANNYNQAGWSDLIIKIQPLEFEGIVQGCLDRAFIAENFEVQENTSPEVRKKINWLKEWLLNEATEEDLTQFLIFSTGLAGIVANKKIQVIGTERTLPLPAARTCVPQIEFANKPSSMEKGECNDYTKESFIKCVKAALNVKTFDII